MSFMRIWTALLAGACAAVPATLCYAVGASLILAPLGREALTSGFLVVWGLSSLACAAPRTSRSQWLAAIWSSAALQGLLFLLVLSTTRAPMTLVACALLGGGLVLLGNTITGSRARR